VAQGGVRKTSATRLVASGLGENLGQRNFFRSEGGDFFLIEARGERGEVEGLGSEFLCFEAIQDFGGGTGASSFLSSGGGAGSSFLSSGLSSGLSSFLSSGLSSFFSGSASFLGSPSF